jgi:hypothetical protein
MRTALRTTAALASLALLSFAGQAEAGQPQREIRILADHTLPAERSAPVDIRWAGDRSVFLLRFIDGVSEIELGDSLKKLRQPVPPPDVLNIGRIISYGRLAASENHLLFGGGLWHMAWRPIGGPKGGEVVFQSAEFTGYEDIDLWGDRVLLLGLRDAMPDIRNDGGIAWLGSLSAGLKDARLLLKDDDRHREAFDWKSTRCGTLSLGAVRFLPDGSFVVVPGTQPGAYRFNPDGQLVRRWSHEEIGLTTDCGGVPAGGALVPPQKLTRWLTRHRALDDILPLPEGPGLLVRSVGKEGNPRWDLTVLGATGVSTYPLPVVSTFPEDRLRGDVRDGKILLLVTSSEYWRQDLAHRGGRLILAELSSR